RRRHGDDIKIRLCETRWLMIKTQGRLLEICRLNFTGAIKPGAQFIYALAVDIESDHWYARSRKSSGDRQANIAEADDGDFASVWQWTPCPRACLTVRHTRMQWGTEQVAVQSNRLLSNAVRGKFRFNQVTAGDTKAPAQIGILRQRVDSCRQCSCIIGWHQE